VEGENPGGEPFLFFSNNLDEEVEECTEETMKTSLGQERVRRP